MSASFQELGCIATMSWTFPDLKAQSALPVRGPCATKDPSRSSSDLTLIQHSWSNLAIGFRQLRKRSLPKRNQSSGWLMHWHTSSHEKKQLLSRRNLALQPLPAYSALLPGLIKMEALLKMSQTACWACGPIRCPSIASEKTKQHKCQVQ